MTSDLTNTLAARFPTAPSWYRAILGLEERLLYRVRDRIPTTAHLHGDDEHAANYAVSERLQIKAAERIVPGANASPYMVQHVARYVWAMAACRGLKVVDLGCGDGYGTFMLSWVASEATGIDIDRPAVDRAGESYVGPTYQCANLADPDSLPAADIGVCFEVLEHVPNAPDLLAAASKRLPRLMLSVPNPLVGGSHINPHHVNDWPLSRLKSIVRAAGATHIRAYHQHVRGFRVGRGAAPWHGTWLLDVSFQN
jgi:2-polyprenyl-3-methyl-5-hydroxy-6-metoxy-1,4-benzoquinol methylase